MDGSFFKILEGNNFKQAQSGDRKGTKEPRKEARIVKRIVG